MVERQHRVRLAAAEVSLKLYDRIASGIREPPDCPDQKLVQTRRQKGAPEKFHRFAVFVRSFAQMNLPEIRGKLRLLVSPARDIFVRIHHFAPRFEATGHLALDGCTRATPLLGSHLLVEHGATELDLHLSNFVGLRRRDRRQQSFGGVQRSIRIVARKRLLMRATCYAHRAIR